LPTSASAKPSRPAPLCRIAQAYERAATDPGSGAELKRRSYVSAGKARDLIGDRQHATQDYQSAINNGSDSTQGDIARRYLKSPYHE
jgi:hypothetical protein